ncbi:MAG: L-threonylcarbamoyladenylate synthase [Oscillospiraceae bacterium]|nr:L-threonylcarbamoyladenylate synthase [Oscillospiraceae bacterium]
METRIIQPNNLHYAADILRSGGVAAIPTETVYGLAANAFDADAVDRIFIAKGRPQDNPLIVHVDSIAMAEGVTCRFPDAARILAERFWPGPLSIILPKNDRIPNNVTAGLDTFAVRMPAHTVAAELIGICGFPLAAPSANISGRPSPTSAAHVLDDLDGRIPVIIDGGHCHVGIESTVVTFGGGGVVILRPGSVTAQDIADAGVEVRMADGISDSRDEIPLSPGQKYRHYRPNAKVILIIGTAEEFAEYTNSHADSRSHALVFAGEEHLLSIPCRSFGQATDPLSQANLLFARLREFDKDAAEKIYVRCPHADGVGAAVYNRLSKAADSTVILSEKEVR